MLLAVSVLFYVQNNKKGFLTAGRKESFDGERQDMTEFNLFIKKNHLCSMISDVITSMGSDLCGVSACLFMHSTNTLVESLHCWRGLDVCH